MNLPSAKSSNASNPNSNSNANARLTAAATAGECGNCGSQKRWVLHHVRIRGIHRRLCTSCVLRLHPTSFCPSCFQFYDPANTPTSSKRLTCSKCSSFTHSHCASSSTNTSSASYICPPCATPNFCFFDLDSVPNRAIDKRLAVVLLCAAKIASASMAKAVIVARAEAERRVKEAAVTRKRAREALDHLALLVHSKGGKAVRKEVAEGSTEVSGSANQKEKEKTFVIPNSQAKETFNGFASPRQNPAVPESPNKRTNNGELEPVLLQTNGNVNDKEKSEGLDSKECMELDKKSHGVEDNALAK
ncbi:hypothetical protein FNV43_RR05187 [Rhamnella rubrinervis]|uniref:Uncharacterized protein n=1 Tax=Rhamnella rubrinervis TaxID=2594499 RepID=A0A8K0HNH6_9ROSA|nr:hypothetical protein FNV43_RR05187 [Rhamnella rubrinervis]